MFDATSVRASPCGGAIAAFETAMRQSSGKPDAGPFLRQSRAAQMSRQPTPDTIKQAEAQAQAAFDAAMARAEQLDARGDRTGCTRAFRRQGYVQPAMSHSMQARA
jgi:hypothetical protein